MTHSYVRHDSFICVTWLIHLCDMTHSYMWHDSYIRVAWLIHMRDMIHPQVWHDSFICVTWLIHLCHDSFLCAMTAPWQSKYMLSAAQCPQLAHELANSEFVGGLQQSALPLARRVSHVWTIHVAHMNEPCDGSYVWYATHCNTLQHTATHCNTLQHTATQPCDGSWIVRIRHVINHRIRHVIYTYINIHDKYDMLHMRIRHVRHVKACHTYECVMAHTWMSHITHMNERARTCSAMALHIWLWMSHVPHMNESCPTYERVMSHIWMSHVTLPWRYKYDCEWVMSHIWMSHVSHMNESCPTYEWIMSHLWMSHVTLPWRYTYDCEWVMSHIWMSHVSHMNESCPTYEWVMSHI